MGSNSMNQMDSEATPVVESKGKNIFSVMVGVFTGPTEAFKGNKLSPKIIVPLIVTIILLSIVTAVQAPYQGKMQVDLLSKSATIPPQVLEQLAQRAENTNLVTAIIPAVIMVVVLGLIGTLIAWFLGSVVMGGEASFKAVWSTYILGGLIAIIGAVVKTFLIMAKGDMYASIGLAALFPNKDFTSLFYIVLTFFDLFAVWSIIVTGIGYGITMGISKGKGITIAFIWYALFTLIMMGLTVIGLKAAGVGITFF